MVPVYVSGARDANAFANNDPGSPWTGLDDAEVHQQVRGWAWTAVDTLDLATDL
jgi:hypothetical protein